MPHIPTRRVEYRRASLQEFDLDGALARKPGVLLLDELAHTNAPGSRHAKRWQDAEELLEAGIDVYTTVNVQHDAGPRVRVGGSRRSGGCLRRAQPLPAHLHGELRHKLEADLARPRFLLTKIGVGYRLAPERGRPGLRTLLYLVQDGATR